jgi:hypothetical protein
VVEVSSTQIHHGLSKLPLSLAMTAEELLESTSEFKAADEKPMMR